MNHAGLVRKIFIHARTAGRFVTFATLCAVGVTTVASAEDTDYSEQSAPAPQPKTDWAERINRTTVKRDDLILLVVHSARDCTWCARWMGLLGGKAEFEKWAQSHKNVGLLVVEREAIATNETPEIYPQDARWVYDWARHIGTLSPRTPTFQIYVGRKVVWTSAGYYSWDRSVFPALKELDSRRAVAIE